MRSFQVTEVKHGEHGLGIFNTLVQNPEVVFLLLTSLLPQQLFSLVVSSRAAGVRCYLGFHALGRSHRKTERRGAECRKPRGGGRGRGREEGEETARRRTHWRLEGGGAAEAV
eukprot:751383-Hanusia_phi.AAC.1